MSERASYFTLEPPDKEGGKKVSVGKENKKTQQESTCTHESKKAKDTTKSRMTIGCKGSESSQRRAPEDNPW